MNRKPSQIGTLKNRGDIYEIEAKRCDRIRPVFVNRNRGYRTGGNRHLCRDPEWALQERRWWINMEAHNSQSRKLVSSSVPNAGGIAVDPQNPSTLCFAGAFNGGTCGFCKSTDAAQSWSCVTLIGISVGTSVTTAIDPVFTNVIYLASSQTVMRSTDGGITWSKAGVVPGAETVITDPRLSGFVYAATGSAIYKSNDFGTSWAVSSQRIIPKGDTPTIEGLFLDPQFGNTIFAAATGL